MEKKKISNFAIFIITIMLIGVIVITKTVVVIKERHEERLLYSMHTSVEYYAKRCYLEGKCNGTITLQMLYDNEYLTEEVVNPVTKEVINHDLEIKYVDEKVVINW